MAMRENGRGGSGNDGDGGGRGGEGGDSRERGRRPPSEPPAALASGGDDGGGGHGGDEPELTLEQALAQASAGKTNHRIVAAMRRAHQEAGGLRGPPARTLNLAVALMTWANTLHQDHFRYAGPFSFHYAGFATHSESCATDLTDETDVSCARERLIGRVTGTTDV
jgi:hypothetical protein